MTEETVSAPQANQKPDFDAWWMLALLFLLYVFSIVDRHVMTMTVVDMKKSLALTDFQMGLVLGPAFSLFYAVFGIPLGWVSDRYSRLWIIFGGVILFSLATFWTALAGSFISLFISRMFVGIGEAALSPAAYSLIADKFPRTMLTTANSIYNTASKVGTSAAYILGGLVLAATAGMHFSLPGFAMLEPWRMVFMIAGLPAIAIAIALLLFTSPEPIRRNAPRNNIESQNLVQFFRAERTLFVPLIIAFCLMGVCSYALISWVPTYLTRSFGLHAAEYGPVLGIISMAAALTLVFKGLIVDALYARGMKDAHIRFYTWILLASIPLVFTMFLVRDSLVFMIMYGLVQVVAIPAIVYMSAVVQLIAPGNLRGQVIAVLFFCVSVIGGGAGPMIVATITDHVFQDDQMVGYSLFIVLGIAMPTAWLLLRTCLKPLRAAIIATE